MFQALRQRYKDVMVKEKNKLKLQRLKFFSFYIIPAILTLFTLIYFFVGIMHAELNPWGKQPHHEFIVNKVQTKSSALFFSACICALGLLDN